MLSMREISRQVGRSQHAIKCALWEANAVIRTHREAHKLAWQMGRMKYDYSTMMRNWNLKNPSRRGSESPGWKGGKYRDEKGYIRIYTPNHPGGKNGYVFEHRLVMEEKLGRYLLPTERVHHVNTIRDDNRPGNLQLISPSDHGIRTQLCSQCGLIKEIKLLQWQIKELKFQLQGRLI
jgi:hypothetical protein